MGRSQATRTEANEFKKDDIRDIRRQLQHLEQQLQRLNENVAPEVAAHPPAEGAPPPITHGKLRAIIEARRARDLYFGHDLFGEPAWDMLLELYACELAQLRMNTSQLCVGAAVPMTTALRWIGILEETGLIIRTDDPLDRRRLFVSLTERGSLAIRSYFEEVSHA